uniref:Acyl-coenzyme A thioesterase 13 n=1 Tax=Rhizophora mucronata TaxID=61149 RepID=A0A2P2PL43_RHIMU
MKLSLHCLIPSLGWIFYLMISFKWIFCLYLYL